MENINNKFNNELQQQIDGTLPGGHIYNLGSPGADLLSAGLPDLPIELSAERLAKKASVNYGHPFDLSELKDLPKSINEPIAVFDSTKKDKSKVILTELQHKGNNYIAIIKIRKSADSRKTDINVNSIRSIYPKNNIFGIIDWINSKDSLLLWIDREKALNFISTQSTNLIASGDKIQGSTINIINNFPNVKVKMANNTLT